jgi:hypothetical protein
MITPQVRDAVLQTLKPGSGHLPSILLSWEQGYMDTTNLFLSHVFSQYYPVMAAIPAATAMRGDVPPQLNTTAGMVLMLDNPHEVDASFITSLNLGEMLPEAGQVRQPFAYGSCAVKYDVWKLGCKEQVPDSCLEGYSGTPFFIASSLSCQCMCCKGLDCGCDRAQMELCSSGLKA